MSRLQITVDNQTFEVQVQADGSDPEQFTVWVDGVMVPVVAPLADEHGALEWALIDNRPYEIALDRNLSWIGSWSGRHSLQIRDRDVLFARPAGGDGRVAAPIPGLIAKVHVHVGAAIELGQPVVVLEAMKMENEIRATRSGSVVALHVRPGQTVGMGDLLVEIA
jgi:biotin carboxyl carrier protein